MLLNVTLPSNAAIYYGALYELANFDLIPTDEIYVFIEAQIGKQAFEEDAVQDSVTSKLSQ